MKQITLTKVLKSDFCKAVFIVSAVLVYLIMPKKIFYEFYIIVGVLFIILSSLIITCFVRSIKDKVISAKQSGKSLLGIITIVLGFGAIHTCAIGAPVCGASIGAGLVALIFPGVALAFLEEHNILIITLTLVFQAIILYSMGCFKVKK